jgi:hypothetical protein
MIVSVGLALIVLCGCARMHGCTQPTYHYDDLKSTLHDKLTQEHDAGHISDSVYHGFRGEPVPEARPGRGENDHVMSEPPAPTAKPKTMSLVAWTPVPEHRPKLFSYPIWRPTASSPVPRAIIWPRPVATSSVTRR